MTGCPRFPLKQRYDRWEYANKQLEKLKRRTGEEMLHVYVCQYCNGHHIGGIHLGDDSLAENVPMAGSYAKGPTPGEKSLSTLPHCGVSAQRRAKRERAEENVRRQEAEHIAAVERKRLARELKDKEAHEAQLAAEIERQIQKRENIERDAERQMVESVRHKVKASMKTGNQFDHYSRLVWENEDSSYWKWGEAV